MLLAVKLKVQRNSGMPSIASTIGKSLQWVSPSTARAAKRVWAVRQRKPWNKAHIINLLSEICGYSHYLELCTSTAGGRYAEIDRPLFSTCSRLMYNCPGSYMPPDGLPINYRTTGLDISECMKKVREDDRCVDIALIDSFHDYECSLRDLVEGFQLLKEGGTLVVHDCLPPTVEVAQPKFKPGEWCGVTYQAFIDFVSSHQDLEFYTVDTDFGCGIIHKRPRAKPISSSDTRTATLADWQANRENPRAAFSSFQALKGTLMNTVSIDEFLARNPTPELRLYNRLCSLLSIGHPAA